MCSPAIAGTGQDEPYAKRPGFDQIARGMGGLMSITAEPECGPIRVDILIANLTAGLVCALGILTALPEREKSGEGQRLHTSHLQAQAFMLDFQATRFLIEDEMLVQVGTGYPTSMPTNRYETKDGVINIAVAGDMSASAFAPPAVGQADSLDFATNEDRRENGTS